MGTGQIDSVGILAATMNEPLAQMFRYNAWANATVLDVCRQLSEDQLELVVDGTAGSIRQTLMHSIGSQDAYLTDLRGEVRDRQHWRKGDWPGFDAMTSYSEASSAALVEAAGSLTHDAPVTLTIEPFGGLHILKSVLLVQAIQHATEHREQICHALTRLGIEPPDLSAWAWGRAAGAIEDVEA